MKRLLIPAAAILASLPASAQAPNFGRLLSATANPALPSGNGLEIIAPSGTWVDASTVERPLAPGSVGSSAAITGESPPLNLAHIANIALSQMVGPLDSEFTASLTHRSNIFALYPPPGPTQLRSDYRILLRDPRMAPGTTRPIFFLPTFETTSTTGASTFLLDIDDDGAAEFSSATPGPLSNPLTVILPAAGLTVRMSLFTTTPVTPTSNFNIGVDSTVGFIAGRVLVTGSPNPTPGCWENRIDVIRRPNSQNGWDIDLSVFCARHDCGPYWLLYSPLPPTGSPLMLPLQPYCALTLDPATSVLVPGTALSKNADWINLTIPPGVLPASATAQVLAFKGNQAYSTETLRLYATTP